MCDGSLERAGGLPLGDRLGDVGNRDNDDGDRLCLKALVQPEDLLTHARRPGGLDKGNTLEVVLTAIPKITVRGVAIPLASCKQTIVERWLIALVQPCRVPV